VGVIDRIKLDFPAFCTRVKAKFSQSFNKKYSLKTPILSHSEAQILHQPMSMQICFQFIHRMMQNNDKQSTHGCPNNDCLEPRALHVIARYVAFEMDGKYQMIACCNGGDSV
jgi:hypothetical protein